MNLLVTNPIAGSQIRTKINYSLSVLPFVFMCVWFVPQIVFESAFFKLVGANSNGIMKDDLKGFLIIIAYLVVVAFLMILGYFLGWFLNAVIMQVFFKWPKEKVKRVFLYSEIPSEWKIGVNEKSKIPFFRCKKPWEEWRKIGKWNFILRCGICGCGIPMFLWTTCLPIIGGSERVTMFNFLLGVCVCSVGGFLAGLIHWHVSEYHYHKQNK